MRELEHPGRDELELDVVLSALADPVRRLIAWRLAELPSQACSAIELPVGKSTATHHYRVLRQAGVIWQRYQGTSILSILRSEDLEARFPGLLQAVFDAERTARETGAHRSAGASDRDAEPAGGGS